MSDIVERLNRGEGCLEEGGKTCISMDAESGCLCVIAADTITRLTAEVERLNSELTDALTDLATARQDNASFMPILNRLTAENEKLRAALERIADTDPDEGTQWFHEVATAALAGDKHE